MERDFEAHLLAWRKSEHRKPMLLSGVRQCGKTYLLQKFGEKHYRQTVYVNFERQQDFHDLFERTLDPRRKFTYGCHLSTRPVVGFRTQCLYSPSDPRLTRPLHLGR